MLTSKHICKGIYGYLGEHLLKIISVSGGYEFTTDNQGLIDTYNFRAKQFPGIHKIYYRLPAPKNVGISAYFRELGVKYRGHTFVIDGGTDDGCYMIAPTWETMQALGDFPRHGYDPRYKAKESEMTDIWEERSPVEGFEFTVEPIVYLKKRWGVVDRLRWGRARVTASKYNCLISTPSLLPLKEGWGDEAECRRPG